MINVIGTVRNTANTGAKLLLMENHSIIINNITVEVNVLTICVRGNDRIFFHVGFT